MRAVEESKRNERKGAEMFAVGAEKHGQPDIGTAAQLFAAARKTHPDLLPAIGRGDFSILLNWLRANVHGKGSLESTDEVLVAATGDRLGTAAFKAHLETRYLSA